ncbi:hypothetical protein SSCG_03681 [Streptomyces clavuligerus]|nr:hypothetical protein SSCG_03681 [Streptomyces clavuligerus]
MLLLFQPTEECRGCDAHRGIDVPHDLQRPLLRRLRQRVLNSQVKLLLLLLRLPEPVSPPEPGRGPHLPTAAGN